MGNLQYSASGSHSVADNRTLPGTWRFAEHQYDYVGQANTMISSSYMGWIDLFGFGTSGWNSGAYAYQPYDTSWEDYDYCSANLAGNYENADWGIYNAISNGGDLPGRWRTLTKDEWDYLLYRRTNATNKVGHATVNGMQGIVILPDDWRLPSSCTFTPDNYDYSYYYGEYRGFYYTNTYSVTQWDDMESRVPYSCPLRDSVRAQMSEMSGSMAITGLLPAIVQILPTTCISTMCEPQALPTVV